MNGDTESKGCAETHEFASDTAVSTSALQLDPHGYPLNPQPSDDRLGQMIVSAGSKEAN